MLSNLVKIIIPGIFAFVLGIISTPVLTDFLYKNKLWKKTSVPKSLDGGSANISQKLHDDENRKTPRMGGIIVWGSVLVVAVVLQFVNLVFPFSVLSDATFISRNQTWLPFFTLIVMAIIGLIDDYQVCKDTGTHVGGGLSLSKRILLVFLVGLLGALWFYAKLEVTSIIVPFFGELQLGIFFIPIFIFAMLSIYAGGIIDGIDGLAGGIFSIIYTTYAVIAFMHGQYDLSAFCMTVSGGLLAFLWFNIPPARFFLSETGTMALTTTLVVVAFLTKAVAVLPIIALPLIITALSSIIQILSKKFRNGKKVFIVAPLHNHFQAIGWPPYKVVMRYWIISLIFALSGLILTLVG